MSDGPAGVRRMLWAIALGSLLVPLNSTMIAVALPGLIDDFDTSLESASWLVTSYLIAMASLQPLAGKLGDRFGRRPMILGGLVWFGLASAAAAASPSLVVLTILRAQQAMAGALVFPNATALLREVFPPEQLGSKMGMVSAAMPLGAAAGPPLGGLLSSLGGWRAVFLANIPILAAALALAWRSLPAPKPPARRRPSLPRFDAAGAALLCLVLAGTALVFNERAGVRLPRLGVMAVLAVVTAAFVARELRHPDPVFQPRLFRRPAFAAANAGVALSNLVMYTTILALPILLGRRGWGERSVGLALAVMSLAAFACSPLGGRLSDRRGRRWPAVCGLALLAGAVVPLAVSPSTLAGGALVALLAVAGVGLGLSATSLQVAALETAAVSHAGVASGVFSTSRYLGSIAGTALLAGPFAPGAGTDGFSALFWALATVGAGAALVALALPGRVRRPPPAGAVEAEAEASAAGVGDAPAHLR